jgi:hypothetical protein
VSSAQIRGRPQPEAPNHNWPLPLPRRCSALEAWRKQRHGDTAPGQRLRQPPRLLLSAAKGLREVRRENHDDPRSRLSGAGENVRGHDDESASATCCRHAKAS